MRRKNLRTVALIFFFNDLQKISFYFAGHFLWGHLKLFSVICRLNRELFSGQSLASVEKVYWSFGAKAVNVSLQNNYYFNTSALYSSVGFSERVILVQVF